MFHKKIWGWILFASAVILYLIGLFSGEFNKYGVYGTSTIAMMLTVFSGMCILLAITVFFVIIAINKTGSEKDA